MSKTIANVTKATLIVAAGLTVGCASFESKDEPVVLPAGTLNQAEVRELFTDRTFESMTVESGRVSTSYYDPNGEIRQRRSGQRRTGYWRVNDSGRICLQMEAGEEKCRIIVKENDTYKKYVVKRNGQHRHVVDYPRIFDGNPANL